MGSSLFPSSPTVGGGPPSAYEQQILRSVVEKLKSALGNIEVALAREADASGNRNDDCLVEVKAEVERAIALVRQRIA